jgi:hypothetical protein
MTQNVNLQRVIRPVSLFLEAFHIVLDATTKLLCQTFNAMTNYPIKARKQVKQRLFQKIQK